MRRFLPLLLLLLLAACTKNEVKLTFELPPDVNMPCRIIYYASGRNVGVIRETVAEISGGKGEITLPMSYPAVIYLFSPSQKMPEAVVYASRGDKFRITGKNANVAEWDISGTATAEALSAWRIKNAPLIKARDRDPERLNKAVAEFVEANPGSEAAAVILYCYYMRLGFEKEFYALKAKLGSNVTSDEKLMTALSMPDLITGLPEGRKVPGRIILTGDSGYADTLVIAKGAGALLMFRGANDSGVSNDSVKALLERNRRRTMAEIYTDIDSLNWRRYLRKDTIKGLPRLWMPMGLADSIALEMGVRRLPCYIVIGPQGKELYHGDDWEAAKKKFDSLSP